jgi:hypothetical protein
MEMHHMRQDASEYARTKIQADSKMQIKQWSQEKAGRSKNREGMEKQKTEEN